LRYNRVVKKTAPRELALPGTTAKRENLLTGQTYQKARTIYLEGGVDAVYPGRYLVTSTTGREYLVDTKRGTCSCPADVTCSHQTAVELYRSARRKRVRDHSPAA
jgi:hypothetical protein